MKINKSDLIEAINKIYLVISSFDSYVIEDQLLHIQDRGDNEYIYIGVEKGLMMLGFRVRVENKLNGKINLMVNFLTFAAIVQHSAEILMISEYGKNILKINDRLINFLPPQKSGFFIPCFPSCESFSIFPEELIKGIEKTNYATSTDTSRFVLMGIAVHQNYISATDGHRLAKFERKISDNDPSFKDTNPIALGYWKEMMSIIANTKSEINVDRNFQTTILTGDDWIFCEGTGTYPNIVEVIPTEFKKRFILSKSSLISALERCGSTVNHASDGTTSYSIDLEISKNYFSVSKGENTEIVKQKQTTGEERTIKTTLDPRYLWDSLKNLDGDELTILFNAKDAPIILKTDNDNGAIALLLPVKRLR